MRFFCHTEVSSIFSYNSKTDFVFRARNVYVCKAARQYPITVPLTINASPR